MIHLCCMAEYSNFVDTFQRVQNMVGRNNLFIVVRAQVGIEIYNTYADRLINGVHDFKIQAHFSKQKNIKYDNIIVFDRSYSIPDYDKIIPLIALYTRSYTPNIVYIHESPGDGRYHHILKTVLTCYKNEMDIDSIINYLKLLGETDEFAVDWCIAAHAAMTADGDEYEVNELDKLCDIAKYCN